MEEDENAGRGGAGEKNRSAVKCETRFAGLQSLRMKRLLLYRASFRAKRLQRLGFGHSKGVGISCANGEMVSCEVGTGKQGSRKVTLAARTV